MTDVSTDSVTTDKFYNKLGINSHGIGQARKAIDLSQTMMRSVICLVGEAGIGKTHIVRQSAEDRKPSKPFTWNGKEWTESVPLVLLPLAQMQSEDTGMPKLPEFERDRLVREAKFWREESEKDVNNAALARYKAIVAKLRAQDTFDVSFTRQQIRACCGTRRW